MSNLDLNFEKFKDDRIIRRRRRKHAGWLNRYEVALLAFQKKLSWVKYREMLDFVDGIRSLDLEGFRVINLNTISWNEFVLERDASDPFEVWYRLT